MTDNKHILKLMNKVKELTIISKKQESLIAIIYTGVLHKSFTGWQELLQEHEILIYLVKKLMIIYSKNLTLNYNYLIIQMIKNINKIKNSFIRDNVIIIK